MSIINDTLASYDTTELQKKFASLTCVSHLDYIKLHQNFLTPLDLKINLTVFANEIIKFDSLFKSWGKHHTQRFGLPLINLDGQLDNQLDPSIGSLEEWARNNPRNFYIENDFTRATAALNMSSLALLEPLKPYLRRSSILKWFSGAEFVPHIDTILPTPWLRLWAVSDVTNFELGYFHNSVANTVRDIEAGRLYIIDTSIIHYAKSFNCKPVYQFFLSTNNDALPILKSLCK